MRNKPTPISTQLWRVADYSWLTFPRPNLSINHAVLVYARKPALRRASIEHYVVYDPNHSDAPRKLTWSPANRAFACQKDWDFVGGFVRVYQVYGKPIFSEDGHLQPNFSDLA